MYGQIVIVEELVKIKIEIESSNSYSAKSKVSSLIKKLCAGETTSGAGKKASTSHLSSCMIEMDPDYYGPCTCKKKYYDDSDFY